MQTNSPPQSKHRMIPPVLTAAAMALAAAIAAPAQAQRAAPPPGFTSLFDGKSLAGWRGDPTIWSVRDGVINGGSDKPIPQDTFLISEKPYGNFELRFKYRWLTADGNSGFMFRSHQVDGNYAMTGYQSNVTPATVTPERFNMLYSELDDRQEMALLGQKAEISRRAAGGGGRGRVVRTVSATVNSRDTIIRSVRPAPEWNEVVVIAYGNHFVGAINGLMAFDAVDRDPNGDATGYFGMQAHSGPPMTVQYKDIFVKPLRAPPNLVGRFKTTPGVAPEPTRTYKDSTRAALPDVAVPD
jgi:hypothetical protein